MTKADWLNTKVTAPESTKDYYQLYDEFMENFDSDLTMESYKRVCRSAFASHRGVGYLDEETGSRDEREVLLDRLNETENRLELSLKTYKIQDVETAANIAGIDLTKWKCMRKTVRASQNTNNPWFIVEGKFELIPEDEISTEQLLENFREILETHETPTDVILPKMYKQDNNTALFSFYDHHIGKRVHGDVTGNGEEWTTELAKQSMLNATDYFIEKTKNEVSRAVFILGNDLLNVDNPEGTTTKGTPQKNDIDYKHLILESTELLITILEKLLNYFELEIIVVPGNHDNNLSFLTGEIIRRYFHNQMYVHVDNSLSPIKYWSFGQNAIGFTHGSEQIKKKYVLPMLMLQQRPEFAAKKYKEFHTGHLHQTKKTQLTEVAEEYGVTMRTLPTLSPTCEWATGKGYQGITGSECIVYNKEDGPIMTFRYSN